MPYSTAKRANGKQTTVLRFRASTNKLRPVYNLLYPAGERQITQPVLDILGAQAAAWCWAESAVLGKRGGAKLSRVGNTRAEAMRLNAWLELLTGARGEVKGLPKASHVFHLVQRRPRKVQEALMQYAPRAVSTYSPERCLMSAQFVARVLSYCMGVGTLGLRGQKQRPWLEIIRPETEKPYINHQLKTLRELPPRESSTTSGMCCPLTAFMTEIACVFAAMSCIAPMS